MTETVIFPSPNWFQVSNLAISSDGWLIYGGPSKSLCILEPLGLNNHVTFEQNDSYKAHVVNRAHSEKITSVDISREWPEKKLILTGSADGCVKQWSIQTVRNAVKIKSTHVLDTHRIEKEEVAGAGYSTESYAITAGSFGNTVKWDLRSNVAKTYKFLRKFKPTCLACSHHVPLSVAVGTRQGVVFVLNLSGEGKIIYKVRGHDDEIVNVSWCPQYEVLMRKTLKESVVKSSAMRRLEKYKLKKNENFDTSGTAKNLPNDSFDESIVQEDDTFDIYKDCEIDEFGHKKFEPEDITVTVEEEKNPDNFLAECLKLKEDILRMKNDPEQSISNLVEALDKTHVDSDSEEQHDITSSNKNETLPHTSCESSAHVQKHLLASIGKLGGVRLWSKSGKLVGSCVVMNNLSKNVRNKGPNSTTILWYKPDILLIADGKSQLLECNPLNIDSKNKLEWKVVHSLHKRGLYCIASNAPRVQLPDEESLSSSNDSDNSSHSWKIWTIAQDRNLICYCMERREMVTMYNTCGGFLYTVQSCPYDAKRIAVSVGDGAVRVLEMDTSEEEESKMFVKHVSTYWQNVQGKVLTVAWHPTRENQLAFATGESRVGLIDASGKTERPARTLPPAIRGAVYSLCWGDGPDLYVAGGGRAVLYRTKRHDQVPETISVELEGKKWDVMSVMWYPTGLLCGSDGGGVAVLDPYTRELITATFIFTKMIHSMEWHPQQTSSSSEVSPFKDLIAFSSLEKSYDIVIVEYTDKGGPSVSQRFVFLDGPKLHKWKTLSGHKYTVLQLAWNPHKDGHLLSTSHDSTIRIWDVSEGVCIAIYGGHVQSSVGAAWSPYPHLSSTVLSGGADCCLNIWKVEDYPPEAYMEVCHENVSRKKRRGRSEVNKDNEESAEVATSLPADGQIAANIEKKMRAPKLFLLPFIHRQMAVLTIPMIRKLAEKCIEKGEIKTNIVYKSREKTDSEEIDDLKDDDDNSDSNDDTDDDQNDSDKEVPRTFVEYWKMFGSTNEVNEVLDYEMQRHLSYGRFEPWVILSIFRGQMDTMIKMAQQKGELCPFLVSLTPCVSYKYWKDVTQLYLAQIGRIAAKGEGSKVNENKWYGGPIYRRAALMLSVHDVKGAVGVLIDSNLFKEAYVLARARHMDSIAQETLVAWADKCGRTGRMEMEAICYLALGDPYKASLALVGSNDQEYLSLAAELAKVAGQSTFAHHIEEKKSLIVNESPETESVELKPLPEKIELLKDIIQISDESTKVNED